MTLGWKPEKGSLEQKRKIFEALWAKQTEEWKGDDRTASEAFMRYCTLSKTKNLNFLSNNAFPCILESITVGLDACQIVIFSD